MKVENRAATGGGQLYQARDPSGGQSGHRAGGVGGGWGAQSQRINCHQFPSNPIRISEEEEEEEDCLSLMRPNITEHPPISCCHQHHQISQT